MFVSGEVLVDGSIYYQTVNAYLAAATSSAGGVVAWATADSVSRFWDDYWRYLWNPSEMDTDLEVGFYDGPAAALPTVFGGSAAATGGGIAGGAVAGGGAAAGTVAANAGVVGTQAVVAPGLGAGTYPVLVINGTAYIARFHNIAWSLAGQTGVETFYGFATINAAGKVIELIK